MTRRVEQILHVSFWIISFWVLRSTFSEVTLDKVMLNGEVKTSMNTIYRTIPILFSIIAKIVIVYSNIFILFPRFSKDNKIKPYTGKLVLLFFIAFALEAVLNYTYILIDVESGMFPFFTTIPLNIFLSLLFFGLSLGYVFAQRNIHNELDKNRLIQEKLNTELKFLKTQINPHFLLNTLNNLYAISEKKKYLEISSGILELSNLMRYMLYEAKAEWVSLEKEVAYLRSVIEIQQFRLSIDDDILISFNIEGNYSDQKIAPLILVSFVENAFKHGIDDSKSSFIKMNLIVKEDTLLFLLSNSNHQNDRNTFEPSGIGLANVKRRLEIIYGSTFDLDISNTDEIFKVKLILPLRK